MPPAIRSFLSVPALAQSTMEEFLELVPGVPLTQQVRDELASNRYHFQKPKVWSFVATTRRTRAVRKNGVKTTEVNHHFHVDAYFGRNMPLGFLTEEQEIRRVCWQRVWQSHPREDFDIVSKLIEMHLKT